MSIGERTRMPVKIKLVHLGLALVLLLGIIEVRAQVRTYKKHRKHLKENTSAALPAAPSGTLNYQGIDYSLEKAPGTFRIVVLGGSAAAGYGTGQGQSWGSVVEAQLEPALGSEIEIVNMAQGAFTSIDDYVNFVKEGVYLNPDFVIVYGGWNDMIAFLSNPGWIVHNTESRLAEIKTNAASHGLAFRFKSRLYLVRKFYQNKAAFERAVTSFYAFLEAKRSEVFKALSGALRLPAEEFGRAFPQSRPKTSRAHYFSDVINDKDIKASYLHTYPLFDKDIRPLYETYYRANLRNLGHFLNEKKIPAFFVFQPDFAYQAAGRVLDEKEKAILNRLLGPNTDAWLHAVRDYYPLGMRIMEEEARAHGLGFVNMEEIVRAYPAGTVFQDNVHYTGEGNRLIGEKLAEILKPVLTRKDAA